MTDAVSENQTDDNTGFVEIIRAAIDESQMMDKDACSAMGIPDPGNGSKKINNGSLIAKTTDLFKLWEITKSPSLQAFVASRIGLSGVSENAAHNNNSDEKKKNITLQDENLMLKKELEEHKKLLAELGADLKKNLNHLTDFTFKKALGS